MSSDIVLACVGVNPPTHFMRSRYTEDAFVLTAWLSFLLVSGAAACWKFVPYNKLTHSKGGRCMQTPTN